MRSRPHHALVKETTMDIGKERIVEVEPIDEPAPIYEPEPVKEPTREEQPV